MDEDGGEDAHEAGQAYDADLVGLTESNEGVLIAFAGGVVAWVHVVCFDAGAPCVLQRPGIRSIADDEGDARRQGVRTDGVKNGLQVRPLPRAEDSERRLVTLMVSETGCRRVRRRYPMRRSMRRMSSSFGTTPTMRSTSFPPLKSNSVGIFIMRNCAATCG